jgi:molecular chaperone GrpE
MPTQTTKATKSKPKTQKNPEVEVLKASLARALADYDNLQKRVERDAMEIGNRIRSQFAAKLFPALEMLYSAQKHLNDPGLALSISQFEAILTEEGIEKITPETNDDFNEDQHEAIDTLEDEGKKGKIAEVSEIGWRFKDDKVIKHAKVKVFK